MHSWPFSSLSAKWYAIFFIRPNINMFRVDLCSCAVSIRRTRLFNDHKIMENIQRQPHHRLQHAKSAEQIKNGFGCMRLVDLFSLNVLRQARWHRQQTTFNLPEKCIQSVLFYFALPVIELHVRANGNVHMHCEDWGTEQNRIQRTCATQKQCRQIVANDKCNIDTNDTVRRQHYGKQ